ncbi:RNA-binding transcriptional accessory protein [bacterium]|nr:RNA-binding transcriptional accessory protein [bacterium]
MPNIITQLLAGELNLQPKYIDKTISLFVEGATIPFISRYRKEMTGSMDEVVLGNLKERYDKLIELGKRKETIIKSISDQGFLTDELENKITNCYQTTELEDIYLPFKPKRKTRSSMAKEKGLEPLAKTIFQQYERDVYGKAASFVNDKVASEEEALQGARDIIAEWINEHAVARDIVRNNFDREAIISSKVAKGKEVEGEKYKDYFDYSGPLKKCPSHRLLAIRRGENEGFLKVNIAPEEDRPKEKLERYFVKGSTESSKQTELAIQDAYKRLLQPSIETEFSKLSKEKADIEAIDVFSKNLRQLLLSSPLGQKRVLALDPGYKSGCKVVCLDEQGSLLHNENIYPHAPQNDSKQAAKKISSMVDAYKIEAIAIGNGTASRETESFIRNLKYNRDIQVFVVSEDGASVYSASKVAREEFPEYDVTVRGAVSIGRRLMDPLAELVKIDPKSIGVGQYQHDVDQSQLKNTLDQVVISSVNKVGVNINTASHHLLTYVSGLGPQLAKNIVDFRNENGQFTKRNELKKVPRLGAKAFEQAAGFLRIANAKNPLDNSAVHPESYAIVEKMAKDQGCKVEDLIKDGEKRKGLDLNKYVSDNCGLPTLKDIIEELEKPGRDPRQIIKVFEFAPGIFSIKDLHVGMTLPGIVTNITNFGAFVDVGVKQDGLVHISQLANKFVSDPNEIVTLHQHVSVKVTDVDAQRKRIQLSMKEAE